MKKNIIKITYIFLLIFTISCDDYLDINQDPNVLSTTDQPKILLPSAQVGLANTLMGWDLGFGGGFWSEYWTQAYTASQFKTLCNYDDDDFDDAYQEFTAVILNDTKRIKLLSTEEENNGYNYIAETISIFTWQVVTDLWGNVPYSEALRGDEGIKSPKFDNAEEIYKDLEARIDALLAIDISTLNAIDKDFDFVFAGDFTYWEKFANSLKLKLMMRQSETPDYSNADVITFINSATFLDKSAFLFRDNDGDGINDVFDDNLEEKRHPMKEFELGGASYISTNVIGSKNFIDYLNTNNDPRIDVLFTSPATGPMGAFFGDFNYKGDSNGDGTNDDEEDYSVPKFAGNIDLMIMSKWEVDFFLAEAYARANDLANAKKYYDMGVTASLEQNAIASTEIITTGYATWVNGSIEENIKQIAMQKWVANANYQHIESFIDRNRTKYPSVDDIDIKADRSAANANFPVGSLTISVNGRGKTNGFLPSSPVYSSDVLNRNINAPSQKANLLQKIWWDKKAGK